MINKKERFNKANQLEWVFDSPIYNSENWLYLKHLKTPKKAIGITKKALVKLLECSGLKMMQYYSENWKEKPGVYFQDVLVFQKK